jgi:hypothetical protein
MKSTDILPELKQLKQLKAIAIETNIKIKTKIKKGLEEDEKYTLD